MTEKNKAIRWTETALIALFLLALILPQLIGSEETAVRDSDAERAGDISSVADLRDKRFAVVLGSFGDIMVLKLFPDAKMNWVVDWAEECIQVAQGKADAVLWEASSLNEMVKQYPVLMALPEAVDQVEYHWCTQKTEEGGRLRQEINAFIAELRAEGLLEEIYHRWEDPETAPDHVEEYPMTAAPQGELKVVSCLDWQPVCYLNGNNACGSMIELVYRFCAWAGYTPVMEYTDIQSIQAGFSTGRYDLLAYGIEWRDETAEACYFTDSIMADDIYAVILKSRYAGAERETAAEEAVPVGKAEKFWNELLSSLDKNFIREDRWKSLLSGLGVTASLAVLSILFGTVLGGVICAMRMSRHPLPNAFARIYIRWLQGMPIVLMLLFLYYVVFSKSGVQAFWVCVLGFSLDFSAYASELFRGGIQAVPPGQQKAAKALGFKPFTAFRHVVFPQMVIHCLPVYVGQVISTVKLTSVAGYISVMDLTRVSDLIRSRTYEAFFPLIVTALIYFAVAWLLTLLLKALENRIDPTRRKRQIKGVIIHAD